MSRVDLARVVDLATALEADSRADPEALRRRDRALGRDLAPRVGDAAARIAAWLDERYAGAGPSPGERARAAERVLRTVLVAVGGLAGAATGLAVFAYDGVQPVNVVQVLAVFVVLQAVLLVGTALLALPESWRRRVPGVAAVQDVLRLASPGRWQPALRRLLPPAEREALDRTIGLARRHQTLYGDAQKWSLLVSSQLFAVAFHASALAAAALLVTFTDLAFGWSTTLSIDAGDLQRFAERIAAPWAWILPDAVPSRALIEETQYFRGTGGFSGEAPRSAEWWRFLLASMACYGLAPRVLVLALARWREAAALRRVFAVLPGVAELRDRLDSRWIATTGEAERSQTSGAPVSAPVPPSAPRPTRVRAVRWSAAPIADADAAALLGAALGSEMLALADGGAGSSARDRALVGELAGAREAVAVLVKGWEPPLLELLDWLSELRAAIGRGTPILVLPLAEGEGGRPVLAGGRDARIWRSRLEATGDPWLHVVTAETSA